MLPSQGPASLRDVEHRGPVFWDAAMRAIQPRCPLFPKTGSAGISLENGLPGSPARFGALILLRSANRKTNENVPQIALRGATRKRGPPSNLD